MAEDLHKTFLGMEERIQRVQQYVGRLEEENTQMRVQLEALQEDLEREAKGEGSLIAKKNIELNNNVRRYQREREFLAEKIKSLIHEVGELKRNLD